ncbi:hypothetical protein ACQKP8_27130, partial [Photobacterium alginatilyticum]|uniref:hypothetical protein n=1 Tax=Photobacterium alginatilyticum TaxID=1775171 RepID=UPI0040679D82
ASELKFTEDETKTILKFIFKNTSQELIDTLEIDNEIRSFAQALLLEAIDASYKIGFAQIIWESTLNPTTPTKKVITKMAKEFAIHYFKHATKSDLRKVKVYAFVVNKLNLMYTHKLNDFIYKYASETDKPMIKPIYNNQERNFRVIA